MPPAARDARIPGIRAEEAALVQTDARYEELQREDIETRSTLAAVQAKMEAIASEMRAVKARQRTLRSSIDNMRSQHRRDLWTNVIPLEVLQLIFEQCTISSADIANEFGQGRKFYDMAAAPFAIASTCSYWRNVALATPRLWTYILCVCEDDGSADLGDTLERAKTLISRSQNAPLEVSLHFADYDSAGDPSCLRTLIDDITSYAARMRSFELWLPPHVHSGSVSFDQFKAPTPLLERFCIIGSDFDGSSDCGFYFAHAPKLQWLEVQHVNVSCPPLPYRFEKLHVLLLWGAYPEEHFRRLATASSSTLQRLVVTEGPQSQHCVSLPNLTILGVCEVLPLLHLCISAPRVHSLELKVRIVVPEMAPFLDHCADRIRALKLDGGDIPEDCLDVLRALYNLETLVCENGQDTADWDSFFGHLAESPAVWPRLRCIRVDEGTGTKLRDGLVKLVHARSAPVTEDDTTGSPQRPAKLVQVDIADSGAPAWLCASVEHWIKRSPVSGPLLESLWPLIPHSSNKDMIRDSKRGGLWEY